MKAEYRFDEPALNIAQKIMECRATAATEGWPDVRLKAAIQCLVIEAMKWAAPGQGYFVKPEELERNTLIAGECPPGSKVILVSSIKRLNGWKPEPAPGGEQ